MFVRRLQLYLKALLYRYCRVHTLLYRKERALRCYHHLLSLAYFNLGEFFTHLFPFTLCIYGGFAAGYHGVTRKSRYREKKKKKKLRCTYYLNKRIALYEFTWHGYQFRGLIPLGIATI